MNDSTRSVFDQRTALNETARYNLVIGEHVLVGETDSLIAAIGDGKGGKFHMVIGTREDLLMGLASLVRELVLTGTLEREAVALAVAFGLRRSE